MEKITRFNIKRSKAFKVFKKVKYDDKNKIFIDCQTNKVYTWTSIASKLKYSVKQTRRIYKEFLNGEVKSFILHKNINNKVNLKYDISYEKYIVEKYKQFAIVEYSDVYIPFTNRDFIFEIKENEENLASESTLYRILAKHVVSPFANRKTKKEFKKKSKGFQKESELQKFVEKSIEYDHKKFKIKDNLKFGERVELDGCSHNWLPHGTTEFDRERKITFHGACDSSGYLLSLKADYEETNKGYIMLLKDVFSDFGAPKEIRGDKRTSFQYKGLQDTVLGKAITSLGTALSCESYGQHKPNIEVTWLIMQRWLPKYLSRKKIKTIDQLMELVNSGEITRIYNKRFAKEKHLEKESVFKRLMEHEIKSSFIVKDSRKVQKGNFLKINNDFWYPVNENNERVVMKENRKNPIFDVHFDLIENRMFIKRCNQKLFLCKADFARDYLDRNKLLSALDSDNELIIFELERANNSLQNYVNKLSSLIYNSKNNYLIRSLEEIGLQK